MLDEKVIVLYFLYLHCLIIRYGDEHSGSQVNTTRSVVWFASKGLACNDNEHSLMGIDGWSIDCMAGPNRTRNTF